jgi:hypothetical protein
MGYPRKLTQNLPKGLARDFFNYEIPAGFCNGTTFVLSRNYLKVYLGIKYLNTT